LRHADYLRSRLLALLKQIKAEGPVEYLLRDYENTLTRLLEEDSADKGEP